ncbi:unnamed protein product, partial [Plutella xylostella]
VYRLCVLLFRGSEDQAGLLRE